MMWSVQRSRTRGESRAQFLCALICALALGGCFWLGRAPSHNNYEANAYYFRVLRKGITAFEDTAGRLPDSLPAICPSLDGARCHWLPFGYHLTDSWGRPVFYTQLGSDYELRSEGADGRPGTPDDVVFRPSSEQALVRRAAGCYLVAGVWWANFSGAELQLDSSAVAPGIFQAAPVVAPYFEPSWEVIGPDSIAVAWPEIHHAIELRVRVVGDSLIGRTAVGRGTASWWPTRSESVEVVAVRHPCDHRDPAG